SRMALNKTIGCAWLSAPSQATIHAPKPTQARLDERRRKGQTMTTTNALRLKVLGLGTAAAVIAVLLSGPSARLAAQQEPAPGISIGSTDLGGTVRGPNGPEAGVWVIAETTDLPTKYAKIVVTDEQGRYLLPELPKANYSVWVRGYGLVDSPKVQSASGKILDLTAVPAPNAA